MSLSVPLNGAGGGSSNTVRLVLCISIEFGPEDRTALSENDGVFCRIYGTYGHAEGPPILGDAYGVLNMVNSVGAHRP